MSDTVEVKVKHVITINKTKIEEALDEMIYCQNKLTEEINATQAYTKSECLERLKRMEQRDLTEAVLRCFGIQSFQYSNTDYRIEIR